MKQRILLSFLIPFLLTSIWFGPGKMLAHAEEGIPFYSLGKTFQTHSHIWQDTGLGSINPLSFPRVTLYAFSAWLNSLRVPSHRVQQLVFFLLIFTPCLIIPSLTRLFFPNSSDSVGLLASFFYIFNLFVLSQVWQRFLYELFFLWSYLPLFLYLWMRWLDGGKKKFLWLLIFSSLVFSTAFGFSSSVLALWIPAGIVWFRNKKLVRALVAMLLWLVSTVWWWYPAVFIKDNPYSQFLDLQRNLLSLTDVSKYFPNSQIWLLKQNYFFGPPTIWSRFYSAKLINLASLALVGILLVGAITSLRQKNGRFLIAWLVVGWFLIKGENPPGGREFYSWLFKTLPFTMVLRNPYEKLGVIFLLPYCLLLAIGLSKVRYRIIKTLVIFTVSFILLRPLWTGQVFAGYQVGVPSSYSQANSYLDSRSDLRLLHLPFLQESGASYTWGYSGDEPADFLFDRPSVSKTYFFPNDPYPYVYKFLRSPQVYKLLQLLAIDTIVVHKDTLPGQVYQENYPGSIAIVDQMEKVSLDRKYEDLDIYRLDPDLPVSWGYLSNRVLPVSSLAEGFAKVINSSQFDPRTDSFVIAQSAPIVMATGLPSYSITKFSPTHYRFNIRNAKTRYLAVLSVSYNDGWKAIVDGQEVGDHLSVNGFANGWLMDKKGDYTINIVFKAWPWE